MGAARGEVSLSACSLLSEREARHLRCRWLSETFAQLSLVSGLALSSANPSVAAASPMASLVGDHDSKSPTTQLPPSTAM